MPVHAQCLRRSILTHKVGQTDLVCGVQSGFISRSVHARLQVCMQQLRFVPPWLIDRHTHTHTDSILISLYVSSASWAKSLYLSVTFGDYLHAVTLFCITAVKLSAVILYCIFVIPKQLSNTCLSGLALCALYLNGCWRGLRFICPGVPDNLCPD